MKNKLLTNMIYQVYLIRGRVSYAHTVSGVVSEVSGQIKGAKVLVSWTTTGAVTD